MQAFETDFGVKCLKNHYQLHSVFYTKQETVNFKFYSKKGQKTMLVATKTVQSLLVECMVCTFVLNKGRWKPKYNINYRQYSSKTTQN